MSLLCSRCGRSIKASAIPEQKPGVGAYAALGPVCARLVGMVAVKRRRLFTVRRKPRSDARQLELPA